MRIPKDVVEEALRIEEPPLKMRWQDILLRAGVERTWNDAVKLFGERATQIAHIFRSIEVNNLRPSHASLQPSIFLSYRHGSPERDKWVRNLAEELERRGYPVTFDKTEKLRNSSEIADLVARIANCRYFVALIDSDYVDSVSNIEPTPSSHSWAYIEWRVAHMLVERFGLLLITLMLGGDRLLQDSILSEDGRAGNTFYVDSAEKLEIVLESFFPATSLGGKHIGRAAAAIAASKEAAHVGDHSLGLELAREAVGLLPDNVKTQSRLSLAEIAMANYKPALKAARKADELAPHQTFVRLILIFAELLAGNHARARVLADEIAHLYGDRWRLKNLQLGLEAVMGEVHAMESCARSLARISPLPLASWSIQWRKQELGIAESDLRPHAFDLGRPIPIAGRDVQRSDICMVRQIDKAREIGSSGIGLIPSLFIVPPDSGPDNLSDLNVLLLAHAAALWLPVALRSRGWEYLPQQTATRRGIPFRMPNGGIVEVDRELD